jgi:hypothetical protein
MPILGIIASQISGHLFQPSGAYDSIATTTVGAGGASSVTFSSIPQTYTHLELRWISRTKDYSAEISAAYVYFNGSRSANYTLHGLRGNGSAASAFGEANKSETFLLYGTGANAGSNTFGVGVTSILDYTNTSKNKTLRTLGGYDNNGSGWSILSSGIIPVTAALTEMVITPQDGNFAQYTQFALYGVKGQ